MTNQTFDFEAITDDELKIAYDGLQGIVAGGFTGFHAGLMANAVGAELPPSMNPLADMGRTLGQKSGLGKQQNENQMPHFGGAFHVKSQRMD